MAYGKQLELTELLAPAITRAGFQLWGLEYAPQQNTALLRIYLDHPERPVTIEDCEAVSREVSALLDVHDPISGEYQLEVSSPGVDRPLFIPEHYARFIGQEVKLETLAPVEGRRRFKGPVLAVEGEQIEIQVEQTRYRLNHRDIVKARVVPDYPELMRAAKAKSKTQ